MRLKKQNLPTLLTFLIAIAVSACDHISQTTPSGSANFTPNAATPSNPVTIAPVSIRPAATPTPTITPAPSAASFSVQRLDSAPISGEPLQHEIIGGIAPFQYEILESTQDTEVFITPINASRFTLSSPMIGPLKIKITDHLNQSIVYQVNLIDLPTTVRCEFQISTSPTFDNTFTVRLALLERLYSVGAGYGCGSLLGCGLRNLYVRLKNVTGAADCHLGVSLTKMAIGERRNSDGKNIEKLNASTYSISGDLTQLYVRLYRQ